MLIYTRRKKHPHIRREESAMIRYFGRRAALVTMAALAAVSFCVTPAIAGGNTCTPALGSTMQYVDNSPYSISNQVYDCTTQAFINVNDVTRSVTPDKHGASYVYTATAGTTISYAYVEVNNQTVNLGLAGPVSSVAFTTKELPSSNGTSITVRTKNGSTELRVRGAIQAVLLTGNDANYPNCGGSACG